MVDVRKILIAEFERLADGLGLTERGFGLRYAHDDKLFPRLRGGRGVQLTSAERILAAAEADLSNLVSKQAADQRDEISVEAWSELAKGYGPDELACVALPARGGR